MKTPLAQPAMLFDSTCCAAEFSPDRVYRYTLRRRWGDGPCIAWLMFNPSTADESQDDPTIRKCIGFSKRWGFGRLVILNLYAVRNSDPRAVRWFDDPVGPMNDYWIKTSLENSHELVCAWGCAQHAHEIKCCIGDRVPHVLSIAPFSTKNITCLGYRKDGHPRHPLMLAYETPREPFEVKK